MAARRVVPGAGLSLRHFIMKAEGRSLYRDVLRAVRGLDESTAAGVRESARERFVANENETDLKRLSVLIIDGQHDLKQMQSMLGGTYGSGSSLRRPRHRPMPASPEADLPPKHDHSHQHGPGCGHDHDT